jgi:hypothetical protein
MLSDMAEDANRRGSSRRTWREVAHGCAVHDCACNVPNGCSMLDDDIDDPMSPIRRIANQRFIALWRGEFVRAQNGGVLEFRSIEETRIFLALREFAGGPGRLSAQVMAAKLG